MSNTLKKAREWHLELRQTLVVEVIDKETKDTVRNYAEILDSLIKQVERAQDSETVKGASWKDTAIYHSEEVLKFQDENKRLRESLKFYVDQKNYAQGFFRPAVLLDGGRTAEKALELT